MANNTFKAGDKVIGVNCPDNIPAEVIETIETEGDYPLISIKYTAFDKEQFAIIPEYRVKLLPDGLCSAGGIHNMAMNGVCFKCGVLV